MAPTFLAWGTVTPAGEGDDYKGFYLTARDISKCLENDEMRDVPVKIEHKGAAVGKVVSAWRNSKGQMDCVLEVEQGILEGAIVSKFMDEGLCRELSLGYMVDVCNSTSGVRVSNKRIVEVSIVKKGARDNCFIHGFTPVPSKRART